jgi:phosphohistidine phosphatase
MRLVIVRHAEAEPGEPDEMRALTDDGRAQADALGRRLRDEGIVADAVLTSPLLRARETAAALGLGTPEPSDALRPGATAEGVRKAVAGRGETVVIVGHQPDCGRIAAELGDGTEPRFPAAGMHVLDLPAW